MSNPFIRGGGVQKIVDKDLEKLIDSLRKNNFIFKPNYELSCKAIKVQLVILNKIAEFLPSTKVNSIKISPTDINKEIRFKSLSNVVEGLQELEKAGFIKSKKEGVTGKVREYWFNPFYFFVGTEQLFLSLFSQDIKLEYPELYVKYCM